MFKRVDRRRKRKENEERLGLDEDQWGVFGLHHTDSSESESDSSDSDSASPSSSDGHSTQSRKKQKRGASLPSDDESGEDEDSEPATDDEEDEEGSSDHGTRPPLTIASALKEPIRPIGPHAEERVCAFCPGKTLKHAAMVKVHEASRIHLRRLKRAQELAMEFSPEEDIQNVLAKSATEAQPKAGGAILSHRAEKRKAKQAKLKEKRKKIKEKKAVAMATANAKKATTTVGKECTAGQPSDADEATHASKRFKVASTSNDLPGGGKNVHRTSLQRVTRKLPTRRRKKETTKSPVLGKSKKRRQMGNETTPAH